MRTPQVRYAIGMIVKYRRGMMSVITGWDLTKNDNADGLTEQVDPNSRFGDKQPYYAIYCDDETSRYVPQGSCKRHFHVYHVLKPLPRAFLS